MVQRVMPRKGDRFVVKGLALMGYIHRGVSINTSISNYIYIYIYIHIHIYIYIYLSTCIYLYSYK